MNCIQEGIIPTKYYEETKTKTKTETSKTTKIENPNKTQDIKPNQYSMDEIYNRFKKTQRPITNN